MAVELWEVGGCVRDEIMGIPSKDIDYSVVADSFEEMKQFILDEGMTIVVERPEFATIRALAPKSRFRGHTGGLDFVWAREDGPYSDGRRPDWTKPGTLMMDLSRRDFTVNAIAKDAQGNLIDPFNGLFDISTRTIRAVGNAQDRLMEDALRGLRAVRFAVQKGFSIDREVQAVLMSSSFQTALSSISTERQR
jgi:tRNA nucleotidyltransferase (CCA-adding enzyme)